MPTGGTGVGMSPAAFTLSALSPMDTMEMATFERTRHCVTMPPADAGRRRRVSTPWVPDSMGGTTLERALWLQGTLRTSNHYAMDGVRATKRNKRALKPQPPSRPQSARLPSTGSAAAKPNRPRPRESPLYFVHQQHHTAPRMAFHYVLPESDAMKKLRRMQKRCRAGSERCPQ